MKRTPLTCARCATRLSDPEKRIYSVHTRLHYCSDVDGCGRRELRRRKSSAKAAA